MSLIQLSERLADRFRVLRSSARGGVVGRHQTLRATVEWSYRLLSVHEQILFDRLSVFAGPFDLEAVEAVCGFEPLDPIDLVDILTGLVDKSLVVVDVSGPDTRYRLLETLRQFGLEQRHGRNNDADVRVRHLGHYQAIASRARGWFEGPRSIEGSELFDKDWDQLRAALDWAETSGDGRSADRLIVDCFGDAMFRPRHEYAAWARHRIDSSSRPDPDLLGQYMSTAVTSVAVNAANVSRFRKRLRITYRPSESDAGPARVAIRW